MSILSAPEPAFLEDEEIKIFRDSVIRFFERHAPESRVEKWRKEGVVEPEFWREAGDACLLGLTVPEEYGGIGGDFRHDYVVMEQASKMDIDGWAIGLHNGIVLPYIVAHATEEQKQRWLPKLVSGEYICSIAMSEPSTGSDLMGVRTSAVRKDDGYVINGQKTFISNGQISNFVVTVCRTDPDGGGKGFSLLVVETENVEGFQRGRKLDKIGCDAQDTSELFYDNVFVHEDNLLGGVEGQGFAQLMSELPKERMLMALGGVWAMERALDETIQYVKERKVFGKSVLDFQNTQFKLAECKSKATIAKVYANHCIDQHLKGELDETTAAIAKYWVTETQCEIVDECLQFFGGYGYINEYPIARLYRDARIQKIYGGTNEIMKVLIARTL